VDATDARGSLDGMRWAVLAAALGLGVAAWKLRPPGEEPPAVMTLRKPPPPRIRTSPQPEPPAADWRDAAWLDVVAEYAGDVARERLGLPSAVERRPVGARSAAVVAAGVARRVVRRHFPRVPALVEEGFVRHVRTYLDRTWWPRNRDLREAYAAKIAGTNLPHPDTPDPIHGLLLVDMLAYEGDLPAFMRAPRKHLRDPAFVASWRARVARFVARH